MKEHILKKISLLRKNKVFFLSNIYQVIEENILEMQETETTIAFLVQDRDVKRGYFATNKVEELPELIRKWPTGTGIDFLSNKKDSNLAHNLNEAGFEPYAVYLKAENAHIGETLGKMDQNKYDFSACEEFLSPVDTGDVEEILHFLYENFNPLTSHIETQEEMCNRIKRGDLVVHKEQNRIVTVLTFDPKPKKLYMEHMLNRGESIFMHMLYYYILQREVKKGVISVDTWIREDNLRALNFVKRYGLEPGRLKNFVYKKD